MRVIPPLVITDAILLSSSVSEPDAGSPSTEFVYNSGATYALGAEVISTSTHRKYESLQAGNNNNPLPVLPETATAWWLDIGPTNKWAMFDLYRNTKTSGTSPITVTIQPGIRIDSIALLGLEATSITVVMQSVVGSPSVEYYRYTEDLNEREIADWYDYFFDPFSLREATARFDLPPYSSAVIVITITNTQGLAACGAIAVGLSQYLGEAQVDAEVDDLNYSVIDRDQATGAVTLTPRLSLPKTRQRVLLDKSIVNAVRKTLKSLDAVPAVWSGADDTDHQFFEPLLILGIYRSKPITLADPTCTLNLELEEI